MSEELTTIFYLCRNNFTMKVILDIRKNRVSFFMELIKSLDYVSVVQELKEKRKSEFVKDLAASFDDVRLHEAGKKKLKSAKDLLNEL